MERGYWHTDLVVEKKKKKRNFLEQRERHTAKEYRERHTAKDYRERHTRESNAGRNAPGESNTGRNAPGETMEKRCSQAYERLQYFEMLVSFQYLF
jgi:hypothetical protein